MQRRQGAKEGAAGGKRNRPCAPGPLGSDSLGSPNFKGTGTPPSCFPPLALSDSCLPSPFPGPRKPRVVQVPPCPVGRPESQELRERFAAPLSTRGELS